MAAKADDVLIEVAALGAGEATTIGHLPARKVLPLRGEKLKVALLGCGAVGAGVLACLKGRPHLFVLNPVFVRDLDKHGGAARFTDAPNEALEGAPDPVVDLLGGYDLHRQNFSLGMWKLVLVDPGV